MPFSSATPAALSRKAFLAIVLALGMAIGVPADMVSAKPRPRTLLRSADPISVDVSPLLAMGLNGFAETLGAELHQQLTRSFAGRLAPGQRVSVLIKGMTLASYSGGERDRRGGGGGNDYLDGLATLTGPGGEVIKAAKILVVSPASSGGAWYIQGGEQRRAAVLAQNFAAWSLRYLGQ